MNNGEKEIRVADILIKKWLTEEELTGEEERLFEDWLEEADEHRVFFQQFNCGVSYREYVEIGQLTSQKKQWERLDSLTRPQRHIGWKRYVACAVAAVLLFVLGTGYWLQREPKVGSVVPVAVVEPGTTQALLILNDGREIQLGNQDTLVNTTNTCISVQMGLAQYQAKEITARGREVEYNTVVVPRGGVYSLVLSDGTRVFLNSESELRYPVHFVRQERNVELKGEAFFDVICDSVHPFIVRTGEMTTRVLGTSFNISAYTDDPAIKTTLFSGRVEISLHETALMQELTPGMQANWRIGSDEIKVKKVNLDIQSLWCEGIIVLDDDELEGVMRMLARWYNVTYEFKAAQRGKHTFTGKINRNEELECVLKRLTLLGGPQFEILGTKVYIY